MNSRYSVFPAHFVNRAKNLLTKGDNASFLYAALELRLGIESRIQPYVQANDQISKSLKRDWHVAKLSKSLEKTASDGKLVSIITLHRQNKEHICTVKFIPLSKNLLKIYDRLGQFLHYRESDHNFSDSWWADLSALLQSGVRDLEICAEGTLLGIPLMRNGTTEVNLKLEMEHKDERFALFRGLAESKELHSTDVQYIPVEEYYAAAR